MEKDIMKISSKEAKLINGDLDLGLIANTDNLHRVKQFIMHLIDGNDIKLTFIEYKSIVRALSSNIKFIKLHDGTVLSAHQIKSIEVKNKVVSKIKNNCK